MGSWAYISRAIRTNISSTDRRVAPIRHLTRVSLQPRPQRYIFQKPRKHGSSTFERCCNDHSIRFQAPQLSWRKIGNDHDFASDQSFGGIRLCNASNNLANFGSEINFEPQQFVRALYFFCNLHLRDPQLDLGEIVNCDLSVASWGGYRRSCRRN